MKSLIKLIILVIALVLVFSVRVKNQTVFGHIYDIISPTTKSAQNATESFFKRSFSHTQTYSKKIFENSIPRVKDSVKSKLSSQKKIEVAEPAEKITEEEKSELNDLIKNH